MWRCRETELNWVRIATRLIPELIQLLMGMSISRYFPAIGTAGFERILVNGCKRVPLPPPIITPKTSFMAGIVDLHRIHRVGWHDYLLNLRICRSFTTRNANG